VPSAAAVRPLPRELTTPPVTKMYFMQAKRRTPQRWVSAGPQV
jgi:hypothetical protein